LLFHFLQVRGDGVSGAVGAGRRSRLTWSRSIPSRRMAAPRWRASTACRCHHCPKYMPWIRLRRIRGWRPSPNSSSFSQSL